MSKQRRTRTDHRGVKLLTIRKGTPSETHVARWTDPDDGKQRQQNLDQLGRTNEESRRAWAKEKAEEIVDRKRRLSLGAVPHTGTSIEDALALYFRETHIGERTRANYSVGSGRFKDWCAKQGIRSTDELRPSHLAAFRVAVRNEPRRRGQSKEPTSIATVNNRLRGVKTILNELRRRGLLPHVHKDDLTDQLRAYKQPRPRAAFLKPDKLRELLKAVQKHDGAVCALTREEKARGLKAGEGKTPKHEPAAPLVLLALLTGARLEELLGLRWRDVDLDAGVIELQAEDVKTGDGREVWLDVTPSLKRLLLALRLKKTGPLVIGGEVAWTRTVAGKLRARLTDTYGAPPFNWSQRSGRTPALRSTCATYSTNAFGIWGDAAHYASAKRLGHSVTIAEKRYAGRWRVPREAKDLEQAMEVADEIAALVDEVTGRKAAVETA